MPRLERVPEAYVDYAYGIFLLDNKHRLIKTLKKRYQPSIHGHRTWGSSFVLMDYLSQHGLRRGSNVMEIGCGWAGASIYCAKKFNANLTGVDLDPAVFPYVDVLAELNGVKVKPLLADFTKVKKADLQGQNYLIGSDICFWDSLVKPLGRLVNRAFAAGVERIIVTDPGRPTFYEFCDAMANKHNAKLQEWYAIEPERYEGEVLDIQPKKQ